jgi:dCMP deaminase
MTRSTDPFVSADRRRAKGQKASNTSFVVKEGRMKEKHLRIRIEQCLTLSRASNCPRRKFGALLLDPMRNVILMDGYNGGPRGGGDLCGGELCLRDSDDIKSGTRVEIGCHHAEMNVICNAAASGVATHGAWLIVTGEPCMMCAKLIHHAGIERVIVVDGGYAGANGVQYLQEHGVEIQTTEGPRDPRAGQASG